MEVVGDGIWREEGVEVTGVEGGYQGNRVRAQQGVRDSRRGWRWSKETNPEGARLGGRVCVCVWGGGWRGR